MTAHRPDVVIDVDDPRRDDVVALLEHHLSFAHAVTPPGHVHALDVNGLTSPRITFFSARRDGSLVAVGALHELDPTHGELKSMHTAQSERGQGHGKAVLDHLLAVARERGYRRVSLQTGTPEAFAPARALYAAAGFVPCPPFAQYTDNPNSVCMTLPLD